MKVKVTKEGLLIPKEVTDRALDSSDEVEIVEEPGRLLISSATKGAPEKPSGDRAEGRVGGEEDPILLMGEDPVDDEVIDASVNHDHYLYTGG